MRPRALASLIVPHVMVEPALQGCVGLLEHTKMPFAKHSCLEPRVAQVLRQKRLVQVDAPWSVPIDDRGLSPEACWVAPCHKCRACRRADGLHVVVAQRHTLRSECVQVWREDATCCVHEVELVAAEVIRKDEYDVGGCMLCGTSSRHARERRADSRIAVLGNGDGFAN